ncbi:MAG: hypothetical protein K8R77_11350 [Anaerolineaceae bacterium]|nr:hypothetical protein [Anaerolineaceae bacterium]
MERKFEQVAASPPRLIPSLGAGFNAVANNVSLIILPIVVDLLLWFGPHLRLKSLLSPGLQALNAQAIELGPQMSPELLEMMRQSQEAWDTIFEHFNLFSALRTLPVGVPSLLAFRGVISNPFAQAGIYESPSFLAAFGSWFLIMLAGILLGTIYFSSVARSSSESTQPFSVRMLARQFLQTMLLTVILILVLMIIAVPLFVVLSISALINPMLGQIVLFAMTFIILWLLLPLFFSPHGIFMKKIRARDAIFQSLRLARMFMPNTGLMILLIVLIGQGMNIIWLLAEWDSWMALVGIAGHAFISSGLLAATFVYYRQGVDWLEAHMQKKQDEPLHS